MAAASHLSNPEHLSPDTEFTHISTSAVLSDDVALRLAGNNEEVARSLQARLSNFDPDYSMAD